MRSAAPEVGVLVDVAKAVRVGVWVDLGRRIIDTFGANEPPACGGPPQSACVRAHCSKRLN